MRSLRCGRVIALLLCLVMLVSQLGMTRFAPAEDGHDHDNEAAADQNAEAPADGAVLTPAASLADPADGTPPAEQPAPEEEQQDDPTAGDEQQDGDLTAGEVTGGDETTDGDEVIGGEITDEDEVPGQAADPDESGQPAGEQTDPAAEDEAETMGISAAPEAEGQPVAAASIAPPVIAIQMAACQKVESSDVFCPDPTVTVTGDGTITVTITTANNGQVSSGPVSSGSTVSLEEAKGQGKITITASNDGGSTTKAFYVTHLTSRKIEVPAAPTCTDYGGTYTYWYCNNCYGSYTPYFVIDRSKAPTGHQVDKYEKMTPCGQTEEVEAGTCSVCGALVDREGKVVEGADHQWVDQPGKDPTCTKPGYTEQKCSQCSAVKRQTIRPLGHLYGEVQLEGDATCTTPGRRTRTCTRQGCGTDEPNHTIVETFYGSHNYVTTTVEATCTTEGYSGSQCSVCGQWKSGKVVIPALGHKYPSSYDCTKPSQCEVCGEERPAQEAHSLKCVTYRDTYLAATKGHWMACQNPGCTYREEEKSHVRPEGADCTKPFTCVECRAYCNATDGAHKWSAYTSDETSHWRTCTNQGCSAATPLYTHTYAEDNDCTVPNKCTVCQHEQPAEAEHDFGGTWYSTSSGHWQQCQNAKCTQISSEAVHTAADDRDCTTNDACSVCGYVVRPKQSGHTFEGSVYTSAGENGHYMTCQNAGCDQHGAVTAHTGGTATCVSGAVCTVCQSTYGGFDMNNHAGSIYLRGQKEATLEEKGYSGDEVCSACNQVVTKGHEIPTLKESCKHETYGEQQFDDKESWYECTVCGHRDRVTPHTYETKYDAGQHWEQCMYCKHEKNHLPHVAIDADADCTTAVKCSCGYVMEAAKAHVWAEAFASDGLNHWHVCTNANCTVTSDPEPHDAVDDGDCTTEVVCSDCGYVTKAAESHVYGTNWYVAAAGHYVTCENEGCTSTQMEDHIPNAEDNNCATAVTCTICSYEISPAQAHSFSGSAWYSDGLGGHFHQCTNPGCQETADFALCSGGTATCMAPAVCDACHAPYGEKDPDNHIGGEELQGYVAPTLDSEGYSGDLVCTGCKAVLEPGHTLDRLVPEHEHVFDQGNSDSEKHWQECTCGAIDESSYKPHSFTGELISDGANGHYRTCDVCGTRSAVEPHTVAEDDHDCTTALTCTDCDHEFAPKMDAHDFAERFSYDADGHWHVCQKENCQQTTEKTHHVLNDDHDCTTDLTCDDCGYVVEAGLSGHAFTGAWSSNGEQHWHVCANDGCTVEDTREGHKWSETLMQDGQYHWRVCTVCGLEGEKEAHEYNAIGECDVCGAKDPDFKITVTPVVDEAAGSGAAAVLEQAVQSLPETDPLMEKILDALEEGAAKITVELEVDDQGVSGSSKTVDIEIVVYADGEELGTLDHTSSAISFTISLDGLTGRVFRVLREHGGVTAVIPSSVSGGTVTFASDLFSTFTIEASSDISWAEVSDIPDQTYTGSAIKPAVTVTVNGGEELIEGVDYTVSYGTNIEGEGTVIITGIGDFEGTSLTKTFRIVKPAAPTDESASGGKATSPRTGDEAPLSLYAGLLGLCAGALALIMIRRRKEQ